MTSEQLHSFEAVVSARRHEPHVGIDALQNEIRRRYRDGEANVECLLKWVVPRCRSAP